MNGLTKRQEKVLDFIADFIQKHGYPPTVREIGDFFGFLWSAARGHLRALERKGFIRIQPLTSRGIEIAGGLRPGYSLVPVVGRVRAGKPLLTVEDIETQLTVDTALFPARDCFCLRVKGESMTEAGILDGDFVIIRRQEEIEPKGIGVVLIGDEATVKRIVIQEDSVTLIPENRTMEPVTYAPDEVKIIGKVIGVIRKL